MSNEELAQRIQNGERERLPELWEQVRRFCDSLAGRYYRMNGELCARRGVLLEDLQQESFLAMVQAAQTYQEGKGCAFIGWLRYYLQNAIAALVGTRNRRINQDPLNRCQSLDAPQLDAEGGEIELDVPDPGAQAAFEAMEEREYRRQRKEAMEQCLSLVEPVQASILRKHYYQRQTLPQIRKQERKGLRRLRRHDCQRLLAGYIEQRREVLLYEAYRGGNEWLSSTERAAQELEAMENKQRERIKQFFTC